MKLSFLNPICWMILVAGSTMIGNRTSFGEEPATPAGPHPAPFAKGMEPFHKRAVMNAIKLRLSGGMDSLIGVEAIPAEEVLRVQLGLAESQGLAVTNVSKDGPAGKAGIQVNDVLILIADKNITDLDSLHKQLQESVDKPVKVGYIRAGTRQTAEITPKELPKEFAARADVLYHVDASKFWLGISLAEADAALRSQLNIPDSEGLVVTSVEADSPAAKSGVMAHDVLLKLDGKALKTIHELSDSLQEIGEKSVALELVRRGKAATLSITPQKNPQGNVSFQVRAPAVQSFYFTMPEKGAWAKNAYGPVRWNAVQGRIDAAGPTVVYSTIGGNEAAKQSLEEQLSRLLDQSRQLQQSLESLKATIHSSGPSASKPEPTPAKR